MSAHVVPTLDIVARPPIGMRRNFKTHVSAKTTSSGRKIMGSEDEEIIVATMFCLQRQIAAHPLHSDQHTGFCRETVLLQHPNHIHLQCNAMNVSILHLQFMLIFSNLIAKFYNSETLGYPAAQKIQNITHPLHKTVGQICISSEYFLACHYTRFS